MDAQREINRLKRRIFWECGLGVYIDDLGKVHSTDAKRNQSFSGFREIKEVWRIGGIFRTHLIFKDKDNRIFMDDKTANYKPMRKILADGAALREFEQEDQYFEMGSAIYTISTEGKVRRWGGEPSDIDNWSNVESIAYHVDVGCVGITRDHRLLLSKPVVCLLNSAGGDELRKMLQAEHHVIGCAVYYHKYVVQGCIGNRPHSWFLALLFEDGTVKEMEIYDDSYASDREWYYREHFENQNSIQIQYWRGIDDLFRLVALSDNGEFKLDITSSQRICHENCIAMILNDYITDPVFVKRDGSIISMRGFGKDIKGWTLSGENF